MNARLRIVSGGQAGVDRAALDAGLAAGLEVGGACPAGRRAEDGPIPARYPLTETASADPAARTRANVRNSDATLILVPAADPATWGPGTRLAVETAAALGRPWKAVVPGAGDAAAVAAIRAWLDECGVAALNVAGPRESEAPGLGAQARVLLDALFVSFPPPA